MEVCTTDLPGCYELRPPIRADARGRFVKPFVAETFAAHGLATQFAESYYTVSRRGVLRGLHFQLPPHDHDKWVYCVDGHVLDVAVDLRTGSPRLHRWVLLELSAGLGNSIYLPRGLAHGFYVLSESATLVYHTTSAHHPAADTGIRWDSAGIPWPNPEPLVSPRDAALPRLLDFVSPFAYG